MRIIDCHLLARGVIVKETRKTRLPSVEPGLDSTVNSRFKRSSNWILEGTLRSVYTCAFIYVFHPLNSRDCQEAIVSSKQLSVHYL